MDALILAGGDGTRLLPLTKNKPKVMIKIYGLPILERSLHVLKRAGIKRAVIVTGFRGEVIKNYFGHTWKGMEIVYKETDWYEDGILKSVIKAKDVIRDRFVFLCGDTIPEEKSLTLALTKKGDMVVSIRNSEEDSVVAQVSSGGRVKNIGMRKDMKKYNFSVAGISVNEPVFFEAVQECLMSGEYDRPNAIQRMIQKGYVVNSFDISSHALLEIDSIADLNRAKKFIFDEAVRTRIKNPGWFKKIFNFPISFPLTKLLAGTNVAPNQITFLCFMLFAASGLLLSLRHFWAGGILCYLGAMFDAVDGKISRLKFKSTYLGKFADSMVDRLCELSVVAGLMLGIYFSSHNYLIFLLGSLCIFFLLGRFYCQGLYYEFMNERIHSSWRWKKSFSSRILDLANRDLNFFIVMISCLMKYPLIGLSYMALSAGSAFIIRAIQTWKTMKWIKKPAF
ncbi:MAG: sugar phosphate nucleotidyltransferase [Candidatus Aminicenantes bacterium]